jgi:hypothetical protein
MAKNRVLVSRRASAPCRIGTGYGENFPLPSRAGGRSIDSLNLVVTGTCTNSGATECAQAEHGETEAGELSGCADSGLRC